MADRYQCAPAAEQRDEEMLATASNVRAWLLVEVRGARYRETLGDFVRGTGGQAHPAASGRLRTQPARADDAGVRLFTVAARRPGEAPCSGPAISMATTPW
jgi:hypothetical protein